MQNKKFSFLFAENQKIIGRLKILDIRLSKEGMSAISSPFSILEESDLRLRLLRRSEFAHKGDMGNALIVAGCYGMAGACCAGDKSFVLGAGPAR